VPIVDVSQQNNSLDNDYGDSRGAKAPTSHEVALFVGDPQLGGTEMADTTEVDDGAGGTTTVANGYARVTIANTSTVWADADGGLKQTVDEVAFADATAEWPDEATHGALIDPVTGDVGDAWPLSAPISVTEAGPVPPVRPQVFYEQWLDQL
jgi:hypothetical protein